MRMFSLPSVNRRDELLEELRLICFNAFSFKHFNKSEFFVNKLFGCYFSCRFYLFLQNKEYCSYIVSRCQTRLVKTRVQSFLFYSHYVKKHILFLCLPAVRYNNNVLKVIVFRTIRTIQTKCVKNRQQVIQNTRFRVRSLTFTSN